MKIPSLKPAKSCKTKLKYDRTVRGSEANVVLSHIMNEIEQSQDEIEELKEFYSSMKEVYACANLYMQQTIDLD